MTKIRVLEDYAGAPGAEVPSGTVISDALITESGDAWYFHPETGEDWLSFEGDYEVVEN